MSEKLYLRARRQRRTTITVCNDHIWKHRPIDDKFNLEISQDRENEYEPSEIPNYKMTS